MPCATPTTPILAVENIEVLYSEVILALKGVNLKVEPGQCTVLLGPNGAGKSTTLKAISGILPSEDGAISAGTVRIEGEAVTGTLAQKMVARGVIHVVEGRKVLRHLSVEQNLLIGGHSLPGAARVKERLASIYETIPRLADLRLRTSGYLSGGEQQQLLIGRALMSEPRLMLIDEPSLGPALITALPAVGQDFVFASMNVLLGGIVILFLLFEPKGLMHRINIFKGGFRRWPFPY